VRGLGPMLAMELLDEQGRPSAALAQAVREHALARGLILLVCGSHGNVIRFLFPLNTPMPLFEQGLDIIDAALAEATRQELVA